MKIIGLTGYAGVGKDTVGAILVEAGWHRIAFADNVRALALEANPMVMRMSRGSVMSRVVTERLSELVQRVGWTEAKKEEEVRRFLQAIGTGVRTVLGDTTWIDAALYDVDTTCDDEVPWAGVVVTDVRHQNEVEAIQGRGGKIVRVRRPGVKPANGHVSETGIDDIPTDYTLVNDWSVDDLSREVADMLFNFSGGTEDI